MSQPLVLAIEPDLRQAAIVKRIIRENALADVVVVDSRDAAIEAIRTNMPDVLLLSALLSPRDEDELVAHLRTLDNAGHLQTHTIPQLASGAGEERESRGLLSAFRRKKEAAPTGGCDPELFADEIRTYLAHAANKKREPPSTSYVALASRPDPDKPESVDHDATHHDTDDAAAGSSWASPFEWKPASANKRSSRAREDAPAKKPAPAPEPLIAAPVPPEPVIEPPSIIKPIEAPIVAPPALVESVVAQRVVEPLVTASPIVEPPIVEPLVVERPALESVLVADAVVIQPPPGSLVSERVGKLVDPPAKKVRTETARPKPVADRPAKLTRAQLQDLIRKQVASDRLAPDGLGPLARWARSDVPSAAKNGSVTSDDIRSLISELAVPDAVASVSYPHGVRLRRVRVPVSSDHDAAHASA